MLGKIECSFFSYAAFFLCMLEQISFFFSKVSNLKVEHWGGRVNGISDPVGMNLY